MPKVQATVRGILADIRERAKTPRCASLSREAKFDNWNPAELQAVVQERADSRNHR